MDSKKLTNSITNVPITNVPIRNVPIRNVPITNVPITNVPITNVPITNVPKIPKPSLPSISQSSISQPSFLESKSMTSTSGISTSTGLSIGAIILIIVIILLLIGTGGFFFYYYKMQKVDCEGTYDSTWSKCDPETGTQTMKFNVTKNPERGGEQCPIAKTQKCRVDCVGSYDESFSACDPVTGKQTKKFNVKVFPKNGGTSCDPDIEVNCDVDCQGEYSKWSDCDLNTEKKTREFITTIKNQNNGKPCPPKIDSADCDVKCEGRWSDYMLNLGGKTATKTFIVTKQPSKSQKCMDPQTENIYIEPTIRYKNKPGEVCNINTGLITQIVDTDNSNFGNSGFKLFELNTTQNPTQIIVPLPTDYKEKSVPCLVPCDSKLEVDANNKPIFGPCDYKTGLQEQKKIITVTAKNGGSNDCDLTSKFSPCNDTRIIRIRNKDGFYLSVDTTSSPIKLTVQNDSNVSGNSNFYIQGVGKSTNDLTIYKIYTTYSNSNYYLSWNNNGNIILTTTDSDSNNLFSIRYNNNNDGFNIVDANQPFQRYLYINPSSGLGPNYVDIKFVTEKPNLPSSIFEFITFDNSLNFVGFNSRTILPIESAPTQLQIKYTQTFPSLEKAKEKLQSDASSNAFIWNDNTKTATFYNISSDNAVLAKATPNLSVYTRTSITPLLTFNIKHMASNKPVTYDSSIVNDNINKTPILTLMTGKETDKNSQFVLDKDESKYLRLYNPVTGKEVRQASDGWQNGFNIYATEPINDQKFNHTNQLFIEDNNNLIFRQHQEDGGKGFCVDLRNGDTSDRTSRLQLWDCDRTNNPNQDFRFV
jgi:hypothetical protein